MTFSVDMGNGAVADANGNQTPVLTADANGNATAIFTMGDGAGRLRADVTYATAMGAGTLDFVSDGWTYYGPGSGLTVTLAADLSNVTATAVFSTWDIYTDGTDYKARHVSPGPAGNAQVDFSGANGAAIVDSDLETGIRTAFTGFNGKVAVPYATTVSAAAVISERADDTTFRSLSKC